MITLFVIGLIVFAVKVTLLGIKAACSRGVFASSQEAGSDFGERPRHCRQKHAGWVCGSIPERLGERDGSAARTDPKNQKYLNLKGEHYGQYFF